MAPEFYSMRKISRKNVSSRSLMRTIFFVSTLFFSISSFAQNNPPSFNGGSSQNLSACFDESGSALNALLAITDLDAGQTETWSVVSGPSHGTLSGFSVAATSTGGTVAPSGVTYVPATGYTGNDSFSIQVSDGIATATTTIYVTVYALPVLSSTLTPASICDQSVFNYTPASFTGGATFSWNRSFSGGISNPPASGTGSISETLMNITYYDVPVTYAYTTTAHGCSSQQNVVVTVHPTPRLSSALYDTTCTGGTFNYVPATTTSGTTFTWSRASVPGISPATSSGTGNISEALTSTNTTSVNVVYVFVLSANGCTATRNVTVTVVPQPPVTSITTTSPAIVCSGTLYQNFGAGIAPPAGATYAWSAVNADIVAVGNTGQYCLVSFPTSGDASVTLNVIMAGAHCVANGTYPVNVGPGISLPGANILYYNYQFVYLDNTQDSYQWGYDNAATLDSTLIPGAVFQSYPITGTSPDFVNNYYWVITTKNGCIQKTYYNGPTAIANVNPGIASGIKLYPNPANSLLNVVMNFQNASETELSIQDVLGQTIKTSAASGQDIQFDIADLPPGCYFVSCSQNGLRVATARFIKN